jgi:hypothetical protein
MVVNLQLIKVRKFHRKDINNEKDKVSIFITIHCYTLMHFYKTKWFREIIEDNGDHIIVKYIRNGKEVGENLAFFKENEGQLMYKGFTILILMGKNAREIQLILSLLKIIVVCVILTFRWKLTLHFQYLQIGFSHGMNMDL